MIQPDNDPRMAEYQLYQPRLLEMLSAGELDHVYDNGYVHLPGSVIPEWWEEALENAGRVKVTIGCPQNSMVYRQHFTEILLDDIMPNGWEEAELDELFDDPERLESCLVMPDAGWKMEGQEYYAHKDALGVLTVYWEGGSCEHCGREAVTG